MKAIITAKQNAPRIIMRGVVWFESVLTLQKRPEFIPEYLTWSAR